MFNPDSSSNDSDDQPLQLLEFASDAPAKACAENPEIKEAFDSSLRELAQDILQYHPDIAHILLGMGGSPSESIHGQN